MKRNSIHSRDPIRQVSRAVSSWGRGKALVLSLLLGSGAAYAAAPPALTNIGNTASASFVDSTGKASLVTSNPVVTLVQQVGGFALDGLTGITTTVINTKTGPAGGTVYAPHVLTNTGNGQDSFNISATAAAGLFSKIEIYADDGAGNPSGAALCSSVGSSLCNIAPVVVGGSNSVFKFVAAYTLPATATGIATPFDTATLTASPIAASAPMYVVTSAVAKDAVDLTTGAAFNMGKSIGSPSVSAPNGGSWPRADSVGGTSSSSSCATTWTTGLTSSASCKYTVYTLTFNNTGAAAGRFAMSDVLPSGLTYVSGSAVWSNAPGTALTEAAGGDSPGIDYQYSGGTLTAVVASLGPNVTQTLSFVVLINPTATAGSATTTNVAYYNPKDAGVTATSSLPGPLTTHTGTTPFIVLATAGVAVGSANSTSATAVDTTPGTPNTTAADQTVINSVVPGGTVKFAQTVYNTGDTTDTVNLFVSPGTFPPGTTFFLFASDGATPLYDTGVLDGVLDTGPIPPGGHATVVLAATLPTGLPIRPVSYSALLTGSSQSDPSKKDATQDSVSSISKGSVDLTNSAAGNGTAGSTSNGDVGPGPSPMPTTVKSTTPGVAASFDLYLANDEDVARTYTLAASASSTFPGNLPPGWTVKFESAGAGARCSAATPAITDTGSVAAHTQIAITACVTPGRLQTPVAAAKIYFRVVATTTDSPGLYASDAITDAVTVTTSENLSYAATLVGNNIGDLASPGSVVYSHILTNVGVNACGPYTLEVKQPASDIAAGWTYAVYLDTDGNGQIGASDQLVTGQILTPLLPGAENAQKFLVRIGAPGGMPLGTSSLATVTAIFAAPNSCGSPSVTDLSNITTGTIRIYKSQAPDAACDGSADTPLTQENLSVRPGGCIYYEVKVVNEGAAAVSNLTINDRAPPYTKLSTAQPATNCSSTNLTGSNPIYASVGAAVSCGSSANILNPGGTVTLDYTVMVDK